MMTPSKCTAVGCNNGKITLLSKVVDCKECSGTGQKWNNMYHGAAQIDGNVMTGTASVVPNNVVIDQPYFYGGYGILTSPGSGMVISQNSISGGQGNGILW